MPASPAWVQRKDGEPGGRCRSRPWHGLWAVTGAFAFLGSETNLVEHAQDSDEELLAISWADVVDAVPAL